MKMFYICTLQYGGHYSYVAVDPLKLASKTEGLHCFILIWMLILRE